MGLTLGNADLQEAGRRHLQQAPLLVGRGGVAEATHSFSTPYSPGSRNLWFSLEILVSGGISKHQWNDAASWQPGFDLSLE